MIVTTNGCFDVLHYGHLKGLEQASKYGELVVGINSDDYIRKFKNREPVHNEEERAYNLSRVKGVSKVEVFTEDTPINFLRKYKPAFHFKSASGYKGLEQSILDEWNGKVIIMKDFEGLSSTKIISCYPELERQVRELCLQKI